MHKNICIWGASITEGYYDTEDGGWVDRIKQYIKFKYGVSVYNLGISGNDTRMLLERFDVEAKARRPDKIIFALGNNDSSYLIQKKHNNTPIEIFSNNIEILIQKAKVITDDVIYVGLTPVDEKTTNPWKGAEERLYLNKNLKEYNNIIKSVCNKQNIKYVDLWDVFISLDYSKIMHDGLHPNAKGHELIFQVVKKELDI